MTGPKFSKMGMLTRLRLLVLLLVGIIFAVFGTWLYSQGKRQIVEEARKQYLQFGTLVGTMIFRNYEITNSAGIQAYLLSLQGVGPDLIGVSVIGEDGKVAADLNERRIAATVDLKKEKLLANAMGGTPQLQILEREKVLEGAFPLSEGGMKPPGVLAFRARLSGLRQLQVNFAFHSVVAAVVIMLGVLLTSGPVLRKAITARITEIVNTLVEMAEGNFTRDLPVRVEDELGTIARSVNTMAQSFRHSVKLLHETSQKTNQMSAELLTILEEQVTSSTIQSTAVAEITTSMEELTRIATGNTGSAEKVASAAEGTLTTSQLGTEAINESAEKITQISTQNRVNLDKLGSLRKQFTKVEEVANFITEMAYQTRLIAFNATLKAAEGGEAGRAFGVIAREIRGLAENVASYAREIHTHIAEIQEATNELAVAAESTTRRIEEGHLANQEAQHAFTKIVDEIQHTTDASRHISQSSLQQQEALEQMLSAFQDVARGAKSVAGSSQQARDSVSHLLEVAGTAEKLVTSFKFE